MTTGEAVDWKERAKEAFGSYLEALERDLAEEAGVVEIEEVMLKHYQKILKRNHASAGG